MVKSFDVLDQRCTITLTRNYRYETRSGTHAITHDDFETKVPVHKCVGTIEGVDTIHKDFMDWTPEGIRGVVLAVEESVKRRAASDKAEKEKLTAVDLVLKELGFK